MRAERVDDFFLRTDRFVDPCPLGSGGMGVVYDVHDRKRDERVALKIMTQVGPAALYRFKQEFRALADVIHPNLVVLHELSSLGDVWFFTMELVRGLDFHAWVVSQACVRTAGEAAPESALGAATLPPLAAARRSAPTLATIPATEIAAGASGALPAELTTRYEAPLPVRGPRPAMQRSPRRLAVDSARLRATLLELAAGLNALHTAGKLHRDIKPSNVMITEEDRVVLLDFGVAVELSPRVGSEARDIAGTPEYMSPEQMAGLPLVEASDWYSVGVMIYEALTGILPHTTRRHEWAKLLQEKRTVAPRPLRDLITGVDPGWEELCQALLRPMPAERASGEAVIRFCGGEQAARPPRIPASPRGAPDVLIGREGHLAALRAAFQRSSAGRAVAIYVKGLSGMGKTALLRRFLDEVVERDEALVLEGRCYERESVPYKGVDSLIDALSRHLAALTPAEIEALLPPHVASLASVFPVLKRAPQIALAPRRSAGIPEAHELRRRAFGALRELLRRLGAARPLVLYIDDLQWGDLDSAALLDELLRPPEAPPMLLVASMRIEAERDHAALGAGSQRAPLTRALPRPGAPGMDVSELRVEPLSREAARELAAVLLGQRPDAAQPEVVAREAGGSPFFVHELVRSVHERGDVALEKVVTLDDVLAERVDRLPPEARRLLEVVAVAGRPIPELVARKAALLGPEEERDALVQLRAGHLVRVLREGGDDQVEAFHDRVRELSVARGAPDEIRAHHLHLATTLEASGHADPEALVEHFAAAGEATRAGTWALAAAEQADRTLAFDRAATLYRMALASRPESEADAALHGRLADALANAGRSADAAVAYLSAAERADGTSRLEHNRRAAEQYLISGRIDEGTRVLDQVLAAVGFSRARTPRRALLSLVAQRLRLRLRGFDFEERPEAEVPAAVLQQIDACWSVARGLGMVDHLRANDFQTRALLLALQAGEPCRVARGLALEAAFIAGAGGPAREAARALLEAAGALARRLEQPAAIGFTTLTAGMGAYLRGEWRRGLALCDEAATLLRERCTGVAWELTSAHRFALGALMYLGEVITFRRRLLERLKDAREQGNLYAATDIRTRFSLAWLAQDEPGEARRQIDAAMSEWSHQGFHLQHYSSLLGRTQCDLYEGKADEAWRRVEQTWPELKASLLLRIQMVRLEAYHLRARAALAVSSGAPERGRLASVEADAARIAREAMGWSTPMAHLLRAAVAAQRGDDTAARGLLRDAIAGFDRADMQLYAAAARRRLGELLEGDAAREALAQADVYLARQEIRDPARLVDMLAPGFRAPGA